MKEEILKALQEIRKSSEEKKRNFDQSVDLIVNLKEFDARKQSLSVFVPLPYKIKDVKICAFLEKQSENFDFCITKADIDAWQDKKTIKNLVKKYDYFVALASIMPKIATQFGRVLGPAGKMPSPQLGVLPAQDDTKEKEIVRKMRGIMRIKAKEPSIKIAIGKQSMNDEEISENISAVYNAIANALQKGKENIKSVMVKFTMGKPVKVKIA